MFIFEKDSVHLVNTAEIFFSFFDLGYQVCLMRGLNVYLLSEKRGADIISQNKEGIYSIFGEKDSKVTIISCNNKGLLFCLTLKFDYSFKNYL